MLIDLAFLDPPTPARAPIVLVATGVKSEMVFDNECYVVQTPDNPKDWSGGFYPASVIGAYFNNVERKDLDTTKAKVTVMQAPKHGALKDTGKIGDGPFFEYHARAGYRGSDTTQFLIELDGKRIITRVKFYVVEKVGDNGYPAGSPAARCEQSEPRRISIIKRSNHSLKADAQQAERN